MQVAAGTPELTERAQTVAISFDPGKAWRDQAVSITLPRAWPLCGQAVATPLAGLQVAALVVRALVAARGKYATDST